MLFFSLCFCIVLVVTNAFNHCSWSVDGTVLDLSYFLENDITIKSDDGVYCYKYTPCQNGTLPCPGGTYGMVTQEVTKDFEEWCYKLAYWDQGITAPKHTVLSWQETWTFAYDNGDGCPGPEDAPRNLTIQWNCRPDVDYEIQLISEGEQCMYSIVIGSKHACSATPTPPPARDCFWQTPDSSHALNLTLLKDTVISNVADDNNQLLYRYTPCDNALKCNQTEVMADVSNLASGDCVTYLAKWQGGQVYAPTYSDQYQTWQFVYLNGETCDGLQSTTQILWVCDPMAGQFKVTKSGRIAPCVYEVVIQSKFACD